MLLNWRCFTFIVFNFVCLTLGQKPNSKQSCEFRIVTHDDNKTTTTLLELTYQAAVSQCLNCSADPNHSFTTLVKAVRRKFRNLIQKKELCKQKCNGVLCNSNGDNFICFSARNISQHQDPSSQYKRCHAGPRTTPPHPLETPPRQKNQVPLIIGFAVGGVMLAVIIAGVFLGRSNNNVSPRNSDVATTPVSMSYSEWISNYSTGGRGSKLLNHRVQEETDSQCSQDVYQSGDVYNIVYDDDSLERYHGNTTGPTIIEVDEALGMEDPFQEFPVNYFPDSVNDPFTFPHEEVKLLHDINQPIELNCDVAVQEEPNNNNKGPKTLHTCYCRGNCVGWPDCIQFAENSSTISSKRKSLSQWSDESEMERRYRYQLESSYGSGFQQRGSKRTSWSSIKSSRRSKSLRHNVANLTHVFVDVHRNMTYSCDDLCSMGNVSTSCRRDSDYLQTLTSNRSIYYPNSLLETGKIAPCNDNCKKSFDNIFHMRQARRKRRYSL